MVKIKQTIEVEIDLHSIPFINWPDEFKDQARNLLSTSILRKKFEETLPEMRKEWLILKLKQLDNLLDSL